RIVLDRNHARRNSQLVALEIDDPILLLVSATTATGRDAPVVVAASGLADRLREPLLRPLSGDLGEGIGRAETRAGRHRLELLDRHGVRPPRRSRSYRPAAGSPRPSSRRRAARHDDPYGAPCPDIAWCELHGPSPGRASRSPRRSPPC